MRRSDMIFMTLAIGFLVHRASAQNSQDLVNLSLSVPQYNQIYVADLDIEHVKSSSVLFIANLQSITSTPIQVKLYVSVVVSLPTESPFQIAWARSTALTLNPGQTKVITNVDLSGDNSPIHLEDHWYDEQEYDRLKNVALATGKAPAGVYQFVVNCLDLNNNPISNTGQAEIVVTNPSRIDLVFPSDGYNSPTPFPRFQWSSNADTVVLSVYEKLPSQQSPQDVVSGVPFLRQTVSGTSFNYPPSGAGVRPLQEGKTYYWYVEIPASATRGSGLRSDIWSFSVGGSATGGTPSENINDAATIALKNFLAGTRWENLVQQIDILNGNAILDGNHISTEELIRLLQNMDKSLIMNVNIEP